MASSRQVLTFNFDKEDVTRHMVRELKLFSNLIDPIQYIIDMLTKNGHCKTLTSLDNIDLSDMNEIEREGKNYYWSVIKYENITFVVRRYGNHLTIFHAVTVKDYRDRDTLKVGAFTYHTDFDSVSDDEHDSMMDERYENEFMDFQEQFKGFVEHIQEEREWLFWNSVSIPRPDYVKIKVAFQGAVSMLSFGEPSIDSIDDTVYCMEEIDHIHLELFAENTMLEELDKKRDELIGMDWKEYGDGVDYKITDVVTDVKDDYYHSVGISLKEKKGKKTKFEDVYSLTRWYGERIFPQPEEKDEE